MLQIPIWVKHAPDFVLWDEGWSYFVEVIGTADDSFKVRRSKLRGLAYYAETGTPLIFFVFNSFKNGYAIVDYQDALGRAGPPKQFSDGNSYSEVPVDGWIPLGLD